MVSTSVAYTSFMMVRPTCSEQPQGTWEGGGRWGVGREVGGEGGSDTNYHTLTTVGS